MITQKQFDYLLQFSSEATSGPKYLESRIEAAKLYLFDREGWNDIKYTVDGRHDVTKQYGKRLAEKLLTWHELLTNWPTNIEGKFALLNKTTSKPMRDATVKATIMHVNTGDNMYKCATASGCFAASVKSAMAKIDKFDEAAKGYGEL